MGWRAPWARLALAATALLLVACGGDATPTGTVSLADAQALLGSPTPTGTLPPAVSTAITAAQAAASATAPAGAAGAATNTPEAPPPAPPAPPPPPPGPPAETPTPEPPTATDTPVIVVVPPLPTRSPTATRSRTPTPLPTWTPSRTTTPPPTATFTSTVPPSATPSSTVTETPIPTETPSATRTRRPTSTRPPTHTPTVTETPTPTETPTRTPLPTRTFTHTPSPTPTATPTKTATPTRTFTVTHTVTPTPTITVTITGTRTIEATITPTGTRTVVATPDGTGTVVATATTGAGTPSPTATTGAGTPSPTRTTDSSASATPTSTRTPSRTPVVDSTPTHTPTGTITPATNTPTRTRTPTRTSTPTRTATPTPPALVQTFSGNGPTTTDEFTVGGGLTILRLTQGAGASISATLVDRDGELLGGVGGLAGTTASSAQRLHADRTMARLEVVGTGTWTIQIDQSPAPATAAAPSTLTGAGEMVSPFFSLREGLALVRLERATPGIGSVALLDAEGFTTALAVTYDSQENAHAVVHVPFDGVFLAAVTADGGWTVEVEQPTPPTPLPTLTPLAGSGQVATGFFHLAQGPARLRFERPAANDDQANVTLWGADGTIAAGGYIAPDDAADAIDVLLHVSTAGAHMLDVRATGTWTVEVTALVPPSPVPTPTAYAGADAGITPFFLLEPGMHVVRMTHAGTGEAQLDLYDAEAYRFDGLSLDAGDGAGARALWVETPVAALGHVQTAGAWQLSFERPTPPAVVPAPAPTQGEGSDVLPFFRLEPGLAVLRATAASGPVLFDLYHGDGAWLHTASLYDEPSAATAFQVPAGGATAVGNVTGSGEWTLAIEQPTPPAVVPTPGPIAGSGQGVSSFFRLDAGLVIIRMSAPTDSFRDVALIDQHGERLFTSTALIGDELLAVGAVPEEGPYLVAATGTGSWTVTLEQPTADSAVDIPIVRAGPARAVTSVFQASGDVSFRFDYQGDGFAQAILYDLEGNPVATIDEGSGPFDVRRTVRDLDGAYLVYVEASQPWTVEVEPR